MVKSFIRYFGGKGTMAKTILEYFPEYNMYVEPYGGGASLLFAKNPSSVEVYNDLEKNVYSVFKCLSDKELFLELKSLCDLAIYSEDLRKEYKEKIKKQELSIVDRAYYFWYINRTSHNGIGGFSINTVVRRGMSKSTSDFLSSIDRMKEIHDRLSSVVVTNKDGVAIIKKYDRVGSFMYLDPPYHHSTRTDARYKLDMTNTQHTDLLDCLLNIKHAKILLSGYNNAEYGILDDAGWVRIDFTVNTTDGNSKPKIKIESLWKNY